MYDALLVILYLAAGLVAGWEARRKGYDDRIMLVLGLVFGPIALLVFFFLKPRALPVGTVVRPVAAIELDGGGRIPRGHVSVVRDVAVTGGTIVCQISAPDRSLHWVAQEALSTVKGVGLRHALGRDTE